MKPRAGQWCRLMALAVIVCSLLLSSAALGADDPSYILARHGGGSQRSGDPFILNIRSSIDQPTIVHLTPQPLWSAAIPDGDSLQGFLHGADGIPGLGLRTDNADAGEQQLFTATGQQAFAATEGGVIADPPALAQDHSGYIFRVGANGAALLDAFAPSGAVRWTIQLPGTFASQGSLIVGNDGDAYLAIGGSSGTEILHLSKTNGTVVAATPLPGEVSAFDLTPEANGVAILASNGSQVELVFINSGGTVTHTVPISGDGSVYSYSYNSSGDVFVSAQTSSAGSCGGTITKVNTSGSIAFQTSLPSAGACPVTGNGNIAALPDGGVAYIANQGTTGQQLGVLNADGSKRWTADPKSSLVLNLGDGADYPLVDTAGHIYVRDLLSNAPCDDGAHTCSGLQIQELDPSTGQVLDSVPVYYSDGVSDLFECGGSFELGAGQFYLVISPDDSHAESCSSLDAFAFVGMQPEYPLPPASTAGTESTAPPSNLTVSAAVVSARPTDPLLKRGISFKLSDSTQSNQVASYQYAWSSSATTPPNINSANPLQTYVPGSSGPALLDYRPTSPKATWYLWARVVTKDGTIGSWSSPTAVQTPLAPILVAVGDSITSGHHKDSGFAKTICNDPDYGYPYYVSLRMNTLLPPKWQATYVNLARSGFSTSDVLDGGTDACGVRYVGSGRTTAPITDGQQDLNASVRITGQESWNRVVITAGINDTNWISTVKKAILSSALIPSSLLQNATCSTVLWAAWSGYNRSIDNTIAANAYRILMDLDTAQLGGDPDAQISWLGYYNMAGTGLLPAGCASAVQQAVNQVDAAIRYGLGATGRSYSWIDPDSVMHMRADRIQQFYLPEDVCFLNLGCKTNPPGWPHPNSAGAQAIAALISVS